MQTSSASTTQTARPPAPRDAAAQGPAGDVADTASGEVALFAELMSKAEALQGAQPGSRQETEEQAAAKEPSASDVIAGLLSPHLADGTRPSAPPGSLPGRLAGSKLPGSDQPGSTVSGSNLPSDDATGLGAAAGDAESGLMKAANGRESAGDALAEGEVGTFDAAARGAAPAVPPGARPGAAPPPEAASALKAGAGTLDAAAAAAAAAGRLAAGAAGRIAAAGVDGAEAERGPRPRRTGRDGSGLAGIGERAGSAASADTQAGTLAAPGTRAIGAAADATGIGANGTDAQAATADAAAAPTHGAGADTGLFALTMNQATAAGGLEATRQEVMAEVTQSAIDLPVDHDGFAEALARQSATLVVQGSNSAEIRLTPQDMGPIRIAITLAADGASLDFAADNAETRAAIEASVPHLRQMLADQGVRLTDWRLGDERTAESQQSTGSDAGRRHGEQADGNRPESSLQRQSTEGTGNPAQGSATSGGRPARGLSGERWESATAPVVGGPAPPDGQRSASANRRLDLYA